MLNPILATKWESYLEDGRLNREVISGCLLADFEILQSDEGNCLRRAREHESIKWVMRILVLVNISHED